MLVSDYSFLIALFWFIVFCSVGDFLRRRTGLLLQYNFFVLLLFIGLSVVRLVLPVELPFTQVIRSDTVLPAVVQLAQAAIAKFGSWKVSVVNILVLVWLFVGAVKLIRLFHRILRDRKTIKGIRRTNDARVRDYLSEVVHMSKRPGKKYKLIVTSDIVSPMVIGVFEPIIIFPKTELDDETLRMQLAHEWQHVLNMDQGIKVVVSIISCVMWWVPATYRMAEHVDNALELRCDLSLTEDMDDQKRIDYLKAILLGYKHASSSRKSSNFYSTASGLVGTRPVDDMVKERLGIIVSHKPAIKYPAAAFILIVGIFFLLSFMFVWQPYYAPPSEVNEAQGAYSVKAFSDNSYIIKSEGMIQVYSDGELVAELPERFIEDTPFSQMEIIDDGGLK